MLHFLDIILSPQDLERINQGVYQRLGQTPNRPRSVFNTQEFKFNTQQFRLDADSNVYDTPAVDSASVDSVVNNGVADSIPNQEGVVDTIKASVSFINGTGGGDDTTTLICTAFVIIAALALCFSFIRLYRKRLPSICGISSPR